MISKKTSLLILLIILIFIESATAAPITKGSKPKIPKKERTEFTETIILEKRNVNLENQEIPENGIIHIQDTVSGTLNSGDTPISGFDLQTHLSGILNINTCSGSYSGKWIITSNSGAFEGTITGNVEVNTISGAFIGHGNVDYNGQRIKGTFRGTVNNFRAEISIQAVITSKID